MMKALVTGGGGFVGSHIAEIYAKKGWDITIVDNLSRGALLKKEIKNIDFNVNFLKQTYPNVSFLKQDIRDSKLMDDAAKGCDVIFHAAAQTAVTTSIQNPKEDFESNALGTINVLEAARKADVKALVYCSTNKVYGDKANSLRITESEKRYDFSTEYQHGISEDLSIDHCEHTPYGCSKLTGDLYAQDYARVYGLKTGVFRMSCIYGTRQFGVEDQGWVAWFTIANILGKPITIYGDGKQVRDVLNVKDLVNLFDKFVNSNVKHGVYNAGGGPKNTLSLLELLEKLKKITNHQSPLSFSNWRPSDQKIFIADISKAEKELNWHPEVNPSVGVQELVQWVQDNKKLLGA